MPEFSTKNVIPNFKAIIKQITQLRVKQGRLTKDHAEQIYQRIKNAKSLKTFQQIYRGDQILTDILMHSQAKFNQLLLKSDQSDRAKHENIKFLNVLFNSFHGMPLTEWKPAQKMNRKKGHASSAEQGLIVIQEEEQQEEEIQEGGGDSLGYMDVSAYLEISGNNLDESISETNWNLYDPIEVLSETNWNLYEPMEVPPESSYNLDDPMEVLSESSCNQDEPMEVLQLDSQNLRQQQKLYRPDSSQDQLSEQYDLPGFL